MRKLNEVIDSNRFEPYIDIAADRELAKQRLQQISEKFKRRFDSFRRNNKLFRIGDLVYVHQDHRRNEK